MVQLEDIYHETFWGFFEIEYFSSQESYRLFVIKSPTKNFLNLIIKIIEILFLSSLQILKITSASKNCVNSIISFRQDSYFRRLATKNINEREQFFV